MEDRLAALESAVLSLTRRVRELEARLETAVSAGLLRSGTPPPAELVEAPAPVLAPVPSQAVTLLALGGRSLIVLGGAYLLRAVTESGAVPALAGVLAGLTYAVAWFFAAGRATARGRRAEGSFDGIVAALIAFPLVVEATVRFHFLAAVSSALALGALTAFALAIAWRTRHQLMAWVVTVGALGSVLALIPLTGEVLPFAAFLLLLGLVTLWLGYDREWIGLRWPVALVADFVGVGLAVRAISEARPEPPGPVLVLLLAMVAAYLGSFAVRTLVRGRNVLPFEVVQTAAVLAVGLGGAVAVVRAHGLGTLLLGSGTLALAAGSYAVAFAFVDRRQQRILNFHFYSLLALVLSVIGLALTLASTGVALAAAGLALATAALGARAARLSLAIHGLVYLAVAGLACGLWAHAGQAFFGPSPPIPGAAGLVVLLTAAACLVMPLGGTQGARAAVRMLLMALVAWGAGGLALGMGAWAVSLAAGTPSAGAVATLRTVTLAATALALAAAYRRWRIVEAGWLGWALLLVTGLQVLLEDLRRAGPSQLFVAFATYGAALMLVPRWLADRAPKPGAPKEQAAAATASAEVTTGSEPPAVI